LRRRGAGLAVAIAAAAGLVPMSALAHASLIAAEPSSGSILQAAPTEISLRFSEPVTPVGAGIVALSPAGRPVASGAARAGGRRLTLPIRPGGTGTYLVTWQVIGSDTHPSRGLLTFSVGHATRPPASEDLGSDVGAVSPWGLLLQALARWLHLAGMALAFGTVAYRVLVLRDAGPERERTLARMLTVGIVLLLVAEPLALAGEAASLGTFAGNLVASSFGRALSLRTGAVLLLWGAVGAVRQAGRGWAWLLGVGAALAIVDGAAGHRIAGAPDVAAVALIAVHEAATAVWLGGLAAVLAGVGGAARFAPVALGCLGVLVVSGAGMAVAHLGGPADLSGSPYGLVLVAKVVAVGVAVAAAVLKVRRFEATALAGVLALAALLSSLPPPR
jgi:copper transport protein